MEKHNRFSYRLFPIVLSFLFFSLFLASNSSAAPPFSATSNTGLQIVTSQFDYIPIGTAHAFNFHVINSTGVLDNRSVSCSFHIYGSDGYHLSEVMSVPMTNDGTDFIALISSGNFTVQGQDSAIIQCNSSIQTGEISFTFGVGPGTSAATNNDVVFILFVILSYGIFLTALIRKDWHLGMFAGILLILFALYCYNLGFDGQINWMTQAFALITLALGMITMLESALAMHDDGVRFL